MTAPSPDLIISRTLCTIGLLVRAQLEDQVQRTPERAGSWLHGFERLQNWAREQRLANAWTPTEQTLHDTLWAQWSRDDITSVMWQIESLLVLHGALGRLPLDPTTVDVVDPDRVQELVPLLPTYAELERGVSPAEAAVLDRYRRAMAVWRWRAKTEFQARHGVTPANGSNYQDMIARAAERAKSAGLIEACEDDFGVSGKRFGDLTEGALRMCATVILERARAIDWVCGVGSWEIEPIL